MGYEISISENGKYIIIEVVEPITGQLEKRFMKDGLDALKAYGIKKIFINVSKVPNVAGVVEQYQLAYEEAVSQELPRDTRIAIFAALDDRSHDRAIASKMKLKLLSSCMEADNERKTIRKDRRTL